MFGDTYDAVYRPHDYEPLRCQDYCALMFGVACMVKYLNEVCDPIAQAHPRVVHLACYSKKHRTRKKNLKRLEMC